MDASEVQVQVKDDQQPITRPTDPTYRTLTNEDLRNKNDAPLKTEIQKNYSTKSLEPDDDLKKHEQSGDDDLKNGSKSPQAEEPLKRTFKRICFGMLCGLLSGLFFSMCSATVKYLDDIDPGQIALYQYMAIFAFSVPFVAFRCKNPFGPDRRSRYWMLLCGCFDAVTVYLAFVSFRYLPLSDATVITSSVPVFVTVAARIFLKEKFGFAQVLAVAISIIGVALVTKLPLLLANRTEIYTRESIIGLLSALGSVITECGIYIILRKLQNVDVFVILLNFGWVAMIVNGILTAVFGEFTFTACCNMQHLLIVAVGVLSFLSQMTLTKALELEEAGPVSILMAAGDIVLAFILDMALFNDTPDSYTIGGTVLVITSVVAVGFKSWIEKRLKIFLSKNSPV